MEDIYVNKWQNVSKLVYYITTFFCFFFFLKKKKIKD